MDEWQESTVQRWESERASRPTADELKHWERTVTDIRVRYKLAEGLMERAELCHRLATAYVKMEDYSQAMSWVDLGLAEGSEHHYLELQEDKALILYLQDRKEEAMAILHEMAEKSPLVHHSKAPRRIVPRATEEAVLNPVCPHCDAHLPYGQLRCPGCGAKVDGRFASVRSTREEGRAPPIEELETHRVKTFSIVLTDYTVDYDDPANFLTVHRVRFLGGEIITITERDWYVRLGLTALVGFYLLYGILLWSFHGVGAPLELMIILSIMMLAILLPVTILYLCIVFPDFLGDTMDRAIPDRQP